MTTAEQQKPQNSAKEQIRQTRIQKLAELADKGINPYPYVFDKNANAADLQEKYKDLEAERILQAVKQNSYIVTLEIKGKKYSSEAFAQKLKDITNEGINDISFIIGGANGLSSKISDISNLKLSFSDMTFTHQMMRILLTEQIYRAFKINANEPYHR